MNTRNRFRYFPFAVMTAVLSVWLQPAIAADPPKPVQQQGSRKNAMGTCARNMCVSTMGILARA